MGPLSGVVPSPDDYLDPTDRDTVARALAYMGLTPGTRIRDINVAPDGSIWLLTDERDGQTIRLSRAD